MAETKQEPRRFLIQDARRAADEVIQQLEPYCEPGRILACGSLRRQRPTVHDIDIVLIPKFMMANQVAAVCATFTRGHGVSGGNLIKHFDYHDPLRSNPNPRYVIPFDIYFATPETWGTLVLIRTGSKENNIRLCARAIELGLALKADGSGLCDQEGVAVPGVEDSEQGIYKALGLPYQEPQYRNTGRA